MPQIPANLFTHFADPAQPGGGAANTPLPPLTVIEKTRDGIQLPASETLAFIAGCKKRMATAPTTAEAQEAAAQLGAFVMAYQIKFGTILTFEGMNLAFEQAVVIKTSQKKELNREEIFNFIKGCVDKVVPGYEIGAWLMSVYLNGLTDQETIYLTEAMWKKGGEINLSDVGGPTADKHAAGGSSDNTSFVIAPLLACFGVKVPMMSGRMLAHTGGTLDKLESIPGFNVNLNEAEVVEQLKNGPGLAIFGQMKTIAPADGILYGLRQLTGTVNNISLIAASIMSKKLAEGAKNLALMGTFGSGAFARNPQEAYVLSSLMMKIAKAADRNVICYMVNFDQPLTPFIGPALEMKAAIQVLKGTADPRFNRFKDLCIDTAARLLIMAGKYNPDRIKAARSSLRHALRSGKALERFSQMIAAQVKDHNDRAINDFSLFKQGKVQLEIPSPCSGFVQKIRADEIGNAVNDLGAGRTEQRQNIEHGVGVAELKLIGDQVSKHQPIGIIYANDEASAKIATERIQKAYTIGHDYVAPPNVIHEVIA